MTYDGSAHVRYTDELASGYVVTIRHDDSPHDSYWYGPSHMYGTTFGVLDHRIAVFDSKVKARNAIRTGYRGSSPSRLKIATLESVRADEATRLEEHASSLLTRAAILRSVRSGVN